MKNDTAAAPRPAYKYYEFLMVGMVTVLLCSNLIGPAKVCTIGVLSFGAGNLFFPISYIFDDLITEVYGYARARRVAWAGLAALIFATVMTQFILRVPPAPNEPYNAVLQPALETVFGGTWRIVAASMFAYLCGDFVNSFVLAKMKVLTDGRWLWTRTVGSTMAGQAVDSLLFYPIAFGGLWANASLVHVIAFNWTFKVLVEIVSIPLIYWIIGKLKRAENLDTFDRGTHFTPFSLKDEGEARGYQSGA
jgi:uncharacterized integral membrane protein (TIGR00697 family)